MAVCARAVQQPDGSFLLGIDSSTTDLSQCAYAVETGSESVLGQLAQMTPDDALVIATAVAGLWAVAWGFRQIFAAISFNKGASNESE